MRFYLDENLSATIAEIARGLGLDVDSVEELGRKGFADEEQLLLAAEDSRCVVTADRDDFIEPTDRFFSEGRPHAGVLIVPSTWQTSEFARIARAMKRYANARGDAANDYLIDFLY